MPLTSAQRLHQSTFREWSEAQEVQLAIWRPLEFWNCVCKGLCVRAHTVDEQRVPKCVNVSMSGRQAHVLEHPCNAYAPSGVDPFCGLWRQVELQAVATCSTSLSSNVMPLLLSCSGAQAWKQFFSRPDIYRRPRVLLEVSYRYHSKRIWSVSHWSSFMFSAWELNHLQQLCKYMKLVIIWLVDRAGYSQTCTRLADPTSITWTKAYAVHQANLRRNGNECFRVPLIYLFVCHILWERRTIGWSTTNK